MLKQALIFSAGVVIGSVATYFAVKRHFEEISREEIDSVKEVYISKCQKMDAIKKLNDEKTRLLTKIYENGYLNGDDTVGEAEDNEPNMTNPYDIPDEATEEIEEESEEDVWERERQHPEEDYDEPHTITPHQFAYEKRYYDKITLLYYKDDGVLVTENDHLIEDPNATIGADTLTKFGEFEDDVAYARNDRLSIDYEVILQHGSYSDTLGEGAD